MCLRNYCNILCWLKINTYNEYQLASFFFPINQTLLNKTEESKVSSKSSLILNYTTVSAAFRVPFKYYLLQLKIIMFIPRAQADIAIEHQSIVEVIVALTQDDLARHSALKNPWAYQKSLLDEVCGLTSPLSVPCRGDAKIKVERHIILTLSIWPYNLFEARLSWKKQIQSEEVLWSICLSAFNEQKENLKEMIFRVFHKVQVYLSKLDNSAFTPSSRIWSPKETFLSFQTLMEHELFFRVAACSNDRSNMK